MAISEGTMTRMQDTIRKAEALVPELERDIQNAVRAGIDVTEQSRRLSDLKGQLRKMRTVYGGSQ